MRFFFSFFGKGDANQEPEENDNDVGSNYEAKANSRGIVQIVND